MAKESDPSGFDTIAGRPDYYIEFLDARTEISDELRVKRIISELLAAGPGMSVLDVGSGTGDDARQIAESVGPDGRVVGLDHSPEMVAEARKRAANTPGLLEFVEGDALALDFPDASFDRTRTERMLIHVPDPVAAVSEMVRVTKPGGLVVASDLDGGTIFTNSSDKELAGALALGMADDLVNGWMGRQLHRYLFEAGLEEIRCVPAVILNSVAFGRRVFSGRLHQMVETGQTTAEAVDRFWAELEEGERAGWLCSGIVCFTVVGRKPV